VKARGSAKDVKKQKEFCLIQDFPRDLCVFAVTGFYSHRLEVPCEKRLLDVVASEIKKPLRIFSGFDRFIGEASIVHLI
jgi:hypothetical protein